jgi:hypothetical protein
MQYALSKNIYNIFIGKHLGMKPRFILGYILVKYTKMYKVLKWTRIGSNN